MTNQQSQQFTLIDLLDPLSDLNYTPQQPSSSTSTSLYPSTSSSSYTYNNLSTSSSASSHPFDGFGGGAGGGGDDGLLSMRLPSNSGVQQQHNHQDEEENENEEGEAAKPKPTSDTIDPNESFAGQLKLLQGMGFTSLSQSRRALAKSGGKLQEAIEYLVSGHIPEHGADEVSLAALAPVSGDLKRKLQELRSMGFHDEALNRQALSETGNNVDKAVIVLVRWQDGNEDIYLEEQEETQSSSRAGNSSNKKSLSKSTTKSQERGRNVDSRSTNKSTSKHGESLSTSHTSKGGYMSFGNIGNSSKSSSSSSTPNKNKSPQSDTFGWGIPTSSSSSKSNTRSPSNSLSASVSPNRYLSTSPSARHHLHPISDRITVPTFKNRSGTNSSTARSPADGFASLEELQSAGLLPDDLSSISASTTTNTTTSKPSTSSTSATKSQQQQQQQPDLYMYHPALLGDDRTLSVMQESLLTAAFSSAKQSSASSSSTYAAPVESPFKTPAVSVGPANGKESPRRALESILMEPRLNSRSGGAGGAGGGGAGGKEYDPFADDNAF